SFSLVLLDGKAGRAILYRNLVGNGLVYYTMTADGLFFGSNLAELVDHSEATPRCNEAMLPVFFLYRFVPGRHTLFAGFDRPAPGEQVIFDSRRLRCSQRRSFADLRRSARVGPDAVDRIEGTMRQVLTDWAALRPQTATLLSGGVDSSYLQAV